MFSFPRKIKLTKPKKKTQNGFFFNLKKKKLGTKMKQKRKI